MAWRRLLHLLILGLILVIPTHIHAAVATATAATAATNATNSVGSTSSYVESHDFLFISGWPQSGTSFMNHIVSAATRDVSTMKERCLLLFQKGCREWNFEGQWILKFHTKDRDVAALLNAGSMCPAGGQAPSAATLDGAVATWGKFWDPTKRLLVEKSPQSMLKIGTLRRLFARARSVRFLVVIKHPVTLNVALPREYDWLTHKESVRTFRKKEEAAKRAGTGPPRRAEYANSADEVAANARYFVQFMAGNRTDGGAGNPSSRCSMGWLTAMERLSRDLRSDPRNAAEVRIVRFEDFVRPAAVCSHVFHFALGPNGTRAAVHADLNVCQRYLSGGTTSYASAPPLRTSRVAPPHGRALRLAGSSVSPDKQAVEFSPVYFERSTHRRIQQFRDALARLPPALRNDVLAVNARLERFGYSLTRGREYLYRAAPGVAGADANVFAPWELRPLPR